MHLAILHYHLNPGGVTQVIGNHLRALVAAGGGETIEQIVVLYGGRRAGWSGPVDGTETADPSFGDLRPTLVALSELEYDSDPPVPDSAALADRIRATLQQQGADPDRTVLHIHNHALGKNVSLPGAFAQLAGNGYRLLLQIHDFAEDFRPDNYRRLVDALGREAAGGTQPGNLAGILYPQAAQIFYAVLNGRDAAILTSAGIEPSQLHVLPNPVAPFDRLPHHDDARAKMADRLGVSADRNLLLYPVRGIRRKNVGEMVLWSALAAAGSTVAITLRPRNPVEAVSYDRWAALAKELHLPCLFGIGDDGGLTFAENLAGADAILTTSVAEGFGMVFLEAWLAGQPLVGRNLPEITADFSSAGVELPWMYRRLAIPLGLVDADRIRAALSDTYCTVCRAYGHPPVLESELNRAFERLTADGAIDFALLAGPLQADMVRRAATDQRIRATLLERNPTLERPGCGGQLGHLSDVTIAENAHMIGQHFGLVPIGRRLLDLYRTILSSNRQIPLAALSNADTILPSFLDPERLHPMRLEP